MLKLKDWKSLFDSKRLKRGLAYYLENRVVSLIKRKYGYSAKVTGNYDDYNIEIIVDKNDHFHRAYCDCPDYKNGNMCKHIAAVFYKIDHVNEMFENKTKEKLFNKINQVIDQLNVDQIKEYLKKVICQEELINDFRMKFIEYFDESGLKEEIQHFYRNLSSLDYKYYYKDVDIAVLIEQIKTYNDDIRYLIEKNKLEDAFECICTGINGILATELDADICIDVIDEYIELLKMIISRDDSGMIDKILAYLENEDSFFVGADIVDYLLGDSRYHDRTMKMIRKTIKQGKINIQYLIVLLYNLQGQELDEFFHGDLFYFIIKYLYENVYRDFLIAVLLEKRNELISYYVREKMIDKLYLEIKDDFALLFYYRDILKNKYHEELTSTIINYIFNRAKIACSRHEYHEISLKIESLLEFNDKQLVIDVINKLINKYPKQSAFIKELLTLKMILFNN